MKSVTRLTLFAVSLLAVAAAQANCEPLLDAIDKLAQQSRFAAYEVDRPDQQLPAEPDTVIIGKVGYVRSGKDWERVDMATTVADYMNLHWKELRAEVAAGNVVCVAAGSGTHRGSPVTKITYDGKAKDSKELESGTAWIDQRTGLVVYEGTANGGLFMVYGDGVKEPVVNK